MHRHDGVPSARFVDMWSADWGRGVEPHAGENRLPCDSINLGSRRPAAEHIGTTHGTRVATSTAQREPRTKKEVAKMSLYDEDPTATPTRSNGSADRPAWAYALLGAGSVAAIGLLVAGVAATMSDSNDSAAKQPPPIAVESARPSRAAIDECNRVAAAARAEPDKPLKDGLLGGAIGAGIGAAGGAIVDGGSGAGKGAGIGAILGATAGTLHGLNAKNSDNERAAQAYQLCMRDRGY
jgi:uncharacterized protein YcfJ